MYKLFLSVRYLMKPLSIVAVLALGLSVMILTFAPAIMAGFQADFHARVRGTQSDIGAYSDRPLEMLNLPQTREALAGVPGVVGVAPYIDYPAIDRHLRRVDYCFIRALDPRLEEKVSEFKSFLLSDYQRFLELNDYDTASSSEKAELVRIAVKAQKSKDVDFERLYKKLEEGDTDPDDPSKRIPCVLAGIFYLRVYDMDVGDVVKLTTATEGGDVKQDRRFKIVGAFRSGTHKQDRYVVEMGIKAAEDFIGFPEHITGYSIKVDDYNKAPTIKAELIKVAKKLMGQSDDQGRKLMPNGIYVRTWEERDENLLKAVGMEKFLIKSITTAIVIAASASIFLVVYLTSNMKIREIGIVRAMGGSSWGAFNIFLTQGSFLALTGLVLGSIGGLVLAVYVNEIANTIHKLTGWHPFPPEVYYLERIPALVETREIFINVVITLVCGLFSALLPAVVAAWRPPIRAIRHD